MTSINPWPNSDRVIDSEWNWEDGIQCIADMLRNWPTAEQTFEVSNVEKLKRFFSVIAGYPLQERFQYPVEAPQETASQKSFLLSQYLESCTPFNLDINFESLRSELLLFDLHFRWLNTENPEKAAKNYLQNSVAWMIAGIFRHHEGNVIESWFKSDAIRRLQISLYAEVNPKIQRLVENLLKDSPSDGGSHSYHMHKMLYSTIKQEPSHLVEFQFHRIQHWLETCVKKNLTRLSSGSLAPRFARGASNFLEIIFSGIRRKLLDRFGPSTILIDGGGRIRLMCIDEDSANNTRAEIHRIYRGLLDVQGPLMESLGSYLNLWQADFLRDSPKDIVYFTEADKRRFLNRWLLYCALPPMAVTSRQLNSNERVQPWPIVLTTDYFVNQSVDADEVGIFVASSVPKITLYNDGPFHSDGRLVGVPAEFKDWFFQKIQSCSLWWDSESISEVSDEKLKTGDVNPFHLLVNRIGARSRRHDKVREGWNASSGWSGNQEKISAIMKLDLNNVGKLFTEPREIDYDNHTMGTLRRLQRIQRRSNLFTTAFLNSFAVSMESFRQQVVGKDIGQFALWSIGGDDVEMAIYAKELDYEPEIFTNWLKKLSKNMEKESRYFPHPLSFSVGVAGRSNTMTVLETATSAAVVERLSKAASRDGSQSEKVSKSMREIVSKIREVSKEPNDFFSIQRMGRSWVCIATFHSQSEVFNKILDCLKDWIEGPNRRNENSLHLTSEAALSGQMANLREGESAIITVTGVGQYDLHIRSNTAPYSEYQTPE